MKQKWILTFLMAAMVTMSFAQTIDVSLVPYRQGDKWGYASVDNKVVIAPVYAEAAWFSEGFAAVKKGNKYGYINKQGKMLIPARFTVAKAFKKGFMPKVGSEGGDSVLFAGASMKADGYEICINTRGATLPKCPAIAENSIASNRGPVQSVQIQKNYSVLNNNGLFDKITDDYSLPGSTETYYISSKGGKYGVYNSVFEPVVPFEYDSIKRIGTNGSYLRVRKNGLFGILYGNGESRIAPENNAMDIITASDGKAYVIAHSNGKSMIKDIDNHLWQDGAFSDIVYDGANGFILTGKDNMKGYMFMDKKMIEPKYSDIRMLNGTNYLIVKNFEGKMGYVHADGTEYFVQ